EDDHLGTVGTARTSSGDFRGQRTVSKSSSSSTSVFSDRFFDEVPRQWIVGVYPGVTLDDLKAWLAPFGVVPLREIYGVDAWVVQGPQNHPGPEYLVARVLREVRELTYAQPNLPMRTLAAVRPNDQYFPTQWNLQHVHLPAAWAHLSDWSVQRPFPSSKSVVRVATVDTGICRHHEDLDDNNLWDEAASIRASDPFDPFICDFSSFHERDRHHGTQVASIVAAITDN